ncbi:MAG TPA: hypothetical protein VKK31_18350 [Thermoanaerobaculia bacterium]|nr:hypothetical protein [Thermoanaerobaculia bacterium]
MAATLGVGQDGVLSLPEEVTWALRLEEGDLVSAESDESEPSRVVFRSYAWTVRTAVACYGQPWLPVAEFLRSPLAAVGPARTLDLSILGSRSPFQPGEPLLLRAEAGRGEPWFRLEPAAGRPPAPELEAAAFYRLQVEPGHQVILPEDALWLLSLSEGGEVTCKTLLNTLESAEERPPGALRVEIGPGGTLPLPEALRDCKMLRPGSDIRFEVNLSGHRKSFRLAPEFSDFGETS